ncbi:hypothetical protein XarzCFBP7410_04900 [Xanthomonas arboricola pv. zantedeschiae]|uniref:DUF262 domain-containing protein n=1 Tax=Xanthomonas arboricola TaxID=56448 RepID=UPI000CEDE08A|nr:DUF262 domain-containing protein [Xanthomonas arboricola]PPT84635.1 hypothetical protein XarzCFBP7410_04900 [Xanthomonas arboricola pv. zantedeschiae]
MVDNNLLTLSKIFTERLFRIPDYQRGYAWTDRQLKDFWSDIFQLEAGKNHYTGVLTLELVPLDNYKNWRDDSWIIDDKSYQPFYVVDGQQRLTTSIILIQVIVETLEAGQELNHNSANDVQKKFLFDSRDKGISRSYIFGYEKDNPSYEFLKSRIFKEKITSGDLQETIYTKNLEGAKSFFIEKVAELDYDQVQVLFKKVTQNLLFNIFTISDDVDVCVAFETMNNRGKPLSYLELLKNRLIYLSYNLQALESEQQKLRAAINDWWRAIYHNLGRNKDNPLDDDRFLLTHYVIYFGNSLVGDSQDGDEHYKYRKLIRATRAGYSTDLLENTFVVKNVLTPKDEKSRIDLAFIFKYVSSLQEAVESWYKIFNPVGSIGDDEIRVWLDKINRIGNDPYTPLLLVFFQKVTDRKRLLDFLKAAERHIFLMSLGSGYRLPPAFAGYPFNIKLAIDMWLDNDVDSAADKVIRSIQEAINSILKTENYSKLVANAFRSNGFYAWDSIRYFLYEYELSLQEKTKNASKKINWDDFSEESKDFITVEHIYPQSAKDAYWKSIYGSYTAKQKKALMNSLGNLLPLSKPKNSSLSNRPFPEKKNGKEGVSVCYKYGSYSEIEVSQLADWTPQEILNRGMKMLAFMEKRWQLSLSGEKAKSGILGLDFLTAKK